MAKLQDGWVFIPKVVAKGTKIEVTERELVFCCSDGEREDDNG